MRRVAFWTIAVPFALGVAAQVGFIVHQIAMLAPKIGPVGAGFAVSVMTSMAIAGRLSLGVVADRLNPRIAAAAPIQPVKVHLEAGYQGQLRVLIKGDLAATFNDPRGTAQSFSTKPQTPAAAP